MSLLPFIWRDMMRPLRMLEHQMRLAEEFFPTTFPTIRYQSKPFIEYSENAESVVHDKNKFQVKLNMQNFAPQEITVKTVNGNSIFVEGKHEEKQDDKGFIARQFIRRFVLSDGYNLKEAVSSLSSDKVLTITVPRCASSVQERAVPITHTGPEKNDKGKEDESQ